MKTGESFVTVMGSVSGFMWVVMRMEEAWPDLDGEGFAQPQYSSHVKYATRAEAEAQGRAEAGNLGVKYES